MATRRKFKRFKMQVAEGQGVIDQLLGLCLQHGMKVDFSWQLPEIFESLLQQNKGGSPTKKTLSHRSPQDALRQIGGPSSVPAQATTRAPPRLSSTNDEDDDVEGADEFAQGLVEEFEEEAPPNPSSGTPMSQEEMVAAYNAKMGGMLRRVSEQGVRYKNSPGPAAGKRLQPHETTSKQILQAKPTAPKNLDLEGISLPESDDEDKEEVDVMEGVPTDFEDVELDVDGPQEVEERPVDDGRVNPKTGMSVGQAREILRKVTGKDVRPPTPGRLNTLKLGQ